MKSWIVLIGLGLIVVGAVASGRRNLAWEFKKRTHLGGFETHNHEEKVHEHEHAHITHNRRIGPDMVAMGEWEHLTSMHRHEHNHPAVMHEHLPHENAEHEHLGEAHIHDHAHPVTS
jgi:hypothetical protein